MMLNRSILDSSLRFRVRTYKKSFGTMSWTENTIFNGWKALERNFDFLRLHGPTADEVIKDVNLKNKTCLITGANSGIGLEMTRCMVTHDCNVLMACRNTYAANHVKNSFENPDLIRVYKTNLSSLSSVKTCADHILRDQQKIDIVILNAAVFGIPWMLTDDGFETTFQVNYLSQYYLLKSIDKILASDARIVFMSSESHRNINWSLQMILNPTEEQLSLRKDDYTAIKAYNVSKLCGILTMHYLGYCWLNTGKTVYCAHPGSFVKTNLCRNWWVYEGLYSFMIPFSKSIRQAASTPIYCATSPEAKELAGNYFKDCQRREESDLAKDMHLSFRIQDLTRDILRQRLGDVDDLDFMNWDHNRLEQTKDAMEEPLISNYTG